MKWRDPRLLLAVILAAIALLRLRFLSVPLERDEGEYAYLGQLILSGEIPYVTAHNMKLPGVYYSYAAILALFGHSIEAIRIGLLLINVATAALLYRLATVLFTPPVGLVAAATFGLLSLSESMLGSTANVEHFAVLPVVAAALLLFEPAQISRGRIFASGLLLGVAYVMKQHAAAFVVVGGLYAVQSRWQQANDSDSSSATAAAISGVAFGIGAITPFALVCGLMYALGAFEGFWFWTVRYAAEYASMFSFTQGLTELEREGLLVFSSPVSLWLLAAAGLGVTLVSPQIRPARARLLGFAIASALAVATGWRFRDHYFLFLVPAASVLAAVGASKVASASGRFEPWARWLIPAVALVAAIAQQRAYLITLPVNQIARHLFGYNPFAESMEIARYLQESAGPDDTVAVIGSEPQIYFYSGVRAATSYIYMYPLMEPQPFAREMQESMIAQIERAQPTYVVMVNVSSSWLRRPDSSLLIFDWTQRTVNESYELVGLAQMHEGRETSYSWGEDARRAPLGASLNVALFRRRDTSPAVKN